MTKIRIPAELVARGCLPATCSRHGAPATWTHHVKVMAIPSAWSIVLPTTRAEWRIPAWPFCDRCRRWRRTGLLIAVSVLCLGAAAMYKPIQIPAGGDISATMDTLLIGGLALIILGLVLTVLFATWTWAARATLSRDAQWVLVRAHPLFAADPVCQPRVSSRRSRHIADK